MPDKTNLVVDFMTCHSFLDFSTHRHPRPTHEPPGCWQLCLPAKVPPATAQPHRHAGPPCPRRPPKRLQERRWQNAPSMRGTKMETNCGKCRAAGAVETTGCLGKFLPNWTTKHKTQRERIKHGIKMPCASQTSIAINSHSPSLALGR